MKFNLYFFLIIGILSLSIKAQNNCDCDFIISSANQSFPNNTNNKTVCFQGNFTYTLNWENIDNKTELCIGENVTFNSAGLNWPNSKNFTISNYGVFNYGQSIELKNQTLINNYGLMNVKVSFSGGMLNNYSGAELNINSWSAFNRGTLNNSNNSSVEIANQYTEFGHQFFLNSDGDIIVNGNFVLNSTDIILNGNNNFAKNFTNNSSNNVISGQTYIGNNFVSNQNNSNITFNSLTTIDGQLNVYSGEVTFNDGVSVLGDTQVNGGSSLIVESDSNFNKLTIYNNGEIAAYTEGCKYINIQNTAGSSGEVNAYNNATLTLNKVYDQPYNEWVLSGNVNIANECSTPETVWEGTVSSDANNPSNWSNGLPSLSVNAIIPETSNNPSLSSNLQALNLNIHQNAVLYSNGNYTLSLSGDILGSGDLIFNDGNLNFVGTERLQSIELSGILKLKNFSVNNPNSVSLNNSSIDLFGVLDLNQGNLITNYDLSKPEANLLTFKSNEGNTAIVAPSTFHVIGEVMIERYIPAQKRAFRYITSSVSTTSSIRENWQEGQNNTSNNYQNNINSNPGFGTHITGSESGNNGFDATLTGNPSMFSWDINTSNWVQIPNTDQTNLIAGKAYSLLIRGDRSTNIYSSNNALGNPTTLRMTGELISGNVDVSNNISASPGAYSLIGNPYQAQVDFKSLLKQEGTNLDKNFYYAYNPNLGSRGGYVVVDLNESPVEITPSNLDNNSNEDNYRYIQPNQAVFVKTSSDATSAPTLVFKESYKDLNTLTNEVFSTTQTPNETAKISMNLYSESLSKVVDGVKFEFKSSHSSAVTEEDALKFWNSGTTIGINNNQNYLSIDKRNYPSEDELLGFWIGNYTTGEYKFNIEVTQLNSHNAFLIDNYTGIEYQLQNNTINQVNFNVDTNISASTSSSRFNIRFNQTTLSSNEVLNSDNVKLYPNPVVNEYFRVSLPSFVNEAKIKVYNNLGQKLISEDIKSNNKISSKGLKSGVYFIEISANENTYNTKLIVK
ncbi:T9SS type A sorting domain-containing protein [Psychroflexus sp. ALD_RP9]|uniref:T9SS type A sorting domain-containing protein n=1 Tax=Psychroflexus sp. ALD_RP9 TaxID=2777186 RepID=UPI001A8F3A21|nr:T9SS type A sorting domain-containing protein [Psychroflexus sp. ALD_RP9]QSS97015.1 T9SS type A sorting domain-containing protein [Psychroflexus sp. ALD_RP9]